MKDVFKMILNAQKERLIQNHDPLVLILRPTQKKSLYDYLKKQMNIEAEGELKEVLGMRIISIEEEIIDLRNK